VPLCLSVSNFICEEKEIRTLEAFILSLFFHRTLRARQHPWPTGLSPLCGWLYSKQLIPKALVLQTSPTLHRWRTHILFADEERFELSTIGLTSRCSAIELFILYVVPLGLEPRTPWLKARYIWPIELRDWLQSLSIQTHIRRLADKSRILLPIELRTIVWTMTCLPTGRFWKIEWINWIFLISR
jgi:hypothetical protein